MIGSHSFRWADFETRWYKRWADELRQTEAGRENYALHANKFWQNAVMAQLLWEQKLLRAGKRAIGFGVGQERLPALFAKYGVLVTATDQDFTTKKAGLWSEYELARGTQSLNQLGICEEQQFAQHVEYMPVDMTNIPKTLHHAYDFLWSNCALGHLGSIPEGLRFITESLACLVPGGWATHTTELNILHDKDTVTSGSTVILRLRDIYELQKELIRRGFHVKPFLLTMGKHPKDRRISLAPQFGNDYSKIQFKGHLAAQIVLAIQKSKHSEEQPNSSTFAPVRTLVARGTYAKNKYAIRHYAKTDPLIKGLITGRALQADAIVVRPVKTKLHVRITKGLSKTVTLAFHNTSQAPLLGVATELTANPIVLATTEPRDRSSKFVDVSWESPNRPSIALRVRSGKATEVVEYVAPGQDFLFAVTLHTHDLRRGTYVEHFGLVQELVGWVDKSIIAITIEVV